MLVLVATVIISLGIAFSRTLHFGIITVAVAIGCLIRRMMSRTCGTGE